MDGRAKIFWGFLLVGAWLLVDCPQAYATAVALSDITASNLRITDITGSGVATIDPAFATIALATAQNSLGEADAESDSETGIPASTTATVTWASGSASSSGTTWTAASGASIPGATDGAANSSGQALWLATLTLDCPTCVGSATASFSLDLAGDLNVMTDSFGQLAQTETILNFLVDGTTLLFRDDLLSIGPSDSKVLSFSTTLTNTMTLDYGTPYDLVLRADSESQVINTVPEPATATLLCLGFGAIGAARARRRRSVTDPS